MQTMQTIKVQGLTGIVYTVNISEGNVQIVDSWLAKGKKEKLQVIKGIQDRVMNVFSKRTIPSILREWKAHNILYKWNYKIERTGCVDIDDNISMIHRICFFILSTFFIE